MNNQQQQHAIELLNLAEHALSHASLDAIGGVIEHTQDRRDHMRVQIIAFLKALDNMRLAAPVAAELTDEALFQMAAKAFGKVVDHDFKGNPITDYSVLLMGAYGPAVRRLVELARANPRPGAPVEQGTESVTCAKSQVEPAAQHQGEPAAIDWPDYHSEGMGCGLEDRGITDRYEACRYGFEEAVERCAELFANGEGLYLHPVERPEPCDGLQQIIHELRTYSPAGDEYKGVHIHKGWAKRLEALFLIPLKVEHLAPVALPKRPRADEHEYDAMTDYEKGLLHGGIELWDKLDELNSQCSEQARAVDESSELDKAWGAKNGLECWGHEPTAKGLFEDGWQARAKLCEVKP